MINERIEKSVDLGMVAIIFQVEAVQIYCMDVYLLSKCNNSKPIDYVGYFHLMVLYCVYNKDCLKNCH